MKLTIEILYEFSDLLIFTITVITASPLSKLTVYSGFYGFFTLLYVHALSLFEIGGDKHWMYVPES